MVRLTKDTVLAFSPPTFTLYDLAFCEGVRVDKLSPIELQAFFSAVHFGLAKRSREGVFGFFGAEVVRLTPAGHTALKEASE